MKLKDYLAQEGLTYEQFASKIGTSKQTIFAYMSGVKPQLKMFLKILKVTDKQVNLTDWFTQEELQNIEKELAKAEGRGEEETADTADTSADQSS